MSASVVEIVFAIDASESMRPCLSGLAGNLEQFLKPLQGFNFKVRLGLVALKVGRSDGGGRTIFTDTLAEGGLDSIYEAAGQSRLFTESADEFIKALRAVTVSGDENSLMALDFALDFPFGPPSKTRRVVALFSDERIEDGAIDESDMALIPDLVQKIGDRRVMLFAAMPSSPQLDFLGSADGAQIEAVQGGDGLQSVNFGKLMGQMAKSISIASLQGSEGSYRRALFGQDSWGTSDSSSFEGMR